MTRQWRRSALWVTFWALFLGLASQGPAQPTGRDLASDPASAEEARERRAMERFLSLVEKNPRRGTALDRVYGYHVERGSLDAFIKSFRDRLSTDPKDDAAALILGLLEFQRGQDAAAVAALRQAEAARPADPLPPYYLGQALVLVGQPEQAADAFERALRRKPTRNDLLEIFQALGRVYQRTQRTEQALAVWARLEALFPEDQRVQEQIAAALAEEDQPAPALARYEALAKKAQVPFRRVQMAMQAAELKVRLNRSEEALKDFERLLGQLRPESWLHKEVRRKIEEVFLRNDDRASLVAYYERWTRREPEDVEALVRLGRTLASMGRVAEAQPWYERAIKLAPGRRDLRLALIGQLAQDQKYAEAAAQYQELDRAEPNNPDTLKDWGALVLRDPSRPTAERKAAAAAIWRRLLEARPNDAVATAQVADLLRQADLVDEALALYRKACDLAPANPQYREYLGEYLHQLKRPAEAMAEWARIAAGANRSARNLGRLGEILAGFGYVKEAIAPLQEAVALEADDFDLRTKLAECLHRLGRFDGAEGQLAAASRLATRDEQRVVVRESRVKNDQAAGRLTMRIAAMRRDLEAHPDSTADRWIELARYLEAAGNLPEAVRAADRAIGADGRSVAAWTLSARVRESAGNLGDAADALRRLAEVDRKNRAEYLTGIARLESRLGRVDAAIKAGRELMAATAAGPEHCEFFARLCFQHGRVEEGLDALRRAVRANPRDTRAVLTLAETLAGQYQTDEAIEMYWRAFDRAEELDNKLDVVRRLTELYLQRNQLDRLLTRLQHQDRDERPGGGATSSSTGRDVAMCLAQAYATSGDLGAARSELDRLLAANTRDTQLLAQLSKLAEEEGDVESAARYQKQLIELAPSDEGSSRLGQLCAKSGDLNEAQSVWSRMAGGQGASVYAYMAMDSLLFHQKPTPVLERTEAMLRKDPHDWEALYRRGVAAAQLDRPELAAQAFRGLLAVRLPDDEKSAFAKARARNPHLQAPNAYPTLARVQGNSPMEERLGLSTLIRMFCRLDNLRSTITRNYTWSPDDFGQARLAALGWLAGLAQKAGTSRLDEVLAEFRKPAEKRPADLRALWDWFYLCSMRLDYPAAYAAARELSRAAPIDPIVLWAFLHSLGGRQAPVGQRLGVSPLVRAQEDHTPPLDKGELDHVLACFRSLQVRRPELAQAEILQFVDDELKRARQVEEEGHLYREAIAGASQIGQVASVLNMAARRGDVEGLIELGERYERLQAGRSQPAFTTGSFTFFGPGLSMCQGMSVCADRKAYGDVLRLLDLNLAATRRRLERQSARAIRAQYTSAPGTVVISAIGSQSVWMGSTYQRFSVPFPRLNEYLDATAIQVLRQAFEVYRRDDLMSDLIAHLRRKADAASGSGEANQARLALSSVLWWSDARDEAIAELTRVVQASRPESDLRLDLAELLEQQSDYAGALASVDAVQPLDNHSLRRREELALRFSVRTGNVDRARQAAERLFGLRLDTDAQIILAGQMHQLGLHELAEALLGRARRRAGNKSSALVTLMLQYQRQDKLDQAVQVAMQILRSTSAMAPSPVLRSADDPTVARTAAIGVLSRSGRLTQLIDRANEELKKAPNAVPIHQALADYYTAARQPARARAELIKVAELRPEDVNLRFQVANQLAREGQAEAAVAHYVASLEKDLSLLDRVPLRQVSDTFRKAGKLDALLRLLGDGELPASVNPYATADLLQELIAEGSLRDRAVALFLKFWKANPTYQAALLSYLTSDAIWQVPEVYDLVRSAILSPNTTRVTLYDQWEPFQTIGSRVIGGQAQAPPTPAARFLDVATARGRLDELAGEFETARKSRRDWTAGDFLLAMTYCRSGRYKAARALVHKLADPKSKDENLTATIYPMYAYEALGTELERHPEMADAIPALYERTLSLPSALSFSRYGLDQNPAGRLIGLYERQGRPEDARRVALRFARQEPPSSTNEDLVRQTKVFALGEMARWLVVLGYAADAVPLYSEALVVAEQISPHATSYYGDVRQLPQQLRAGLESALGRLKADELAPIAGRLITDASAGPAANDESKPSKSKVRDQVLDLVLIVYPRALDRATVRSLLAESLAACDAQQLAALDEPMEKLRRAHPDDLSVAIASALQALVSGESGRIGPALERLDRLVERALLEPLPPGGRANARQRAEAARQVPLWLVARACDKGPEAAAHHTLADRLAARALEAARRQADNTALMAMLREQGERALARGDRKGAEAVWTRMLETVIAPMKASPRRPAPGTRPPVTRPGRVGTAHRDRPAIPVRRVAYQDAPKSQPATPKARTKAAPSANLPILTLDRFEQAMQIARLAAERDLPDLSFRAIREALQAGPPVVPTNPNAEARALRMAQRGIDEGTTDPVAPRVVSHLVALEQVWQEHHVPPVAVYEALRGAVLPDGRPAEVFLYAPPLNARALRRTRSAGAMLAAWAVRAGQVDALRKAIEGRKGQPLSELPAAILTAQLALAAHDDASTIAALKTLAERLKHDTLRTTAELACHAALPALDRSQPEIAKAAVDVLDGCVKGFESGYQPEPVGTLLVLLARRQWQLGDVPGARKRLDAYMEAMEKNASRYGGDYSLFIRKQHLERVASEYARAGLWTDALSALGRYADSPGYSEGDPPVTGALARLMRRLAATPAKERYTTLHDWTMPAKDRRVVRILAAQGVRDLAPDVFSRAAGNAATTPEPAASPASAGQSVISTSTALIDAARQAGALDKLADEARAAAEQKIENAEALLVLVELARGQGPKVATRIEARVAELVKQNQEKAREKPKPESQNAGMRFGERMIPRFPWNDYLMGRAALGAEDPAIAGLGRRLVGALIEHAEKTDNYPVLASLRGDLAEAAAHRAGAPQALTASLPSSWRPAEVRPGYDLAANGSPAYWAAHEGHVAHPSGSTTDLLVFDYPLAGSYEVSVDAYVAPWAGSVVVHDGLCVLPSVVDGNAQVYPVGQGETIQIPWKLSRPEGFNRVTIQAGPGRVRYLVNGHLLYDDDDPSPVSPWLGLLTFRERSSAWRNLSLKGSPTIPREVKLSQGDRLEGWVSSFYRETQPSRRTDQVTDRFGNVTTVPGAQRRRSRGPTRSKKPRTTVNVEEYDWAAKDGVIHGRRVPHDATVVDYYDPESVGTVTEADQSRLYYHRPLGDGDAITYEFLYEPGQVVVHPALDRVAFLLEPDGVKVHWMTAGGNDISGLPADNAIDEPANRRGPRPLPLKAGQWNAVKLSLSGDRLAIELNGQAVYERPMEPALGRQFGLFHYKDQTSARVRNLVLTGKWPGAIPDRLRADLAAMSPSEKPSDAMRRARHAIVGEEVYALGAGAVVERARTLRPADRYAMLADWVLPSPDHPLVRLEGDFTPSFPADPGIGPGGTLRAPAIELVAAARELGTLDELAARVEKSKAEGDDPFAVTERGRLALSSLIQAARGDDAAAGKSIEALRAILEKQPLDPPGWTRWPELVAADRAVSRPAVGKSALALAEMLVNRAEKRPITEADNRVPSTLWEAQVKHLRARASRPAGPAEDSRPDPGLPHGKPVVQTRAQSRGEGQPVPGWSSRDGLLSHQPGHADDMVYLAVPLRGKFELACELTAPAGREIRVAYGGQVLGLKADGKHLERSQIGRPMPDVAITPPIEKPGDWYALRLAVDGNRMSVSINGRKVHEAPLPTECDPWVALLCPATQSGSARKIALDGNPQVPDRLNLSALPDLAGWRTDEYAETTTGDDADWEKRGEEIVGRLIEDIAGARQESVLRYHRPMLEDGRIAYEFYYDPGKALVHPALDRLAFLLEPDGVRVHRLTDGAYERSGLAPDNAVDEPEDRRGPASLPLKPKSWNQMAVVIKGDRATLELNGQAIHERTLEPSNRRAFGLFHYADATQARVRNVTYQGDWPRSLPAAMGQ